MAVPTGFKRFFIQQQTYNGQSYTLIGSKVDLFEAYRIACQEFPFKLLPEAKDVAKREWPEEDGEDVYISEHGIPSKAYDVEAKFLYYNELEENKSAHMKTDITNFVNFIRGKVGSGGSETASPLLNIEDAYTGISLNGVYVSDVSSDLYDYSDKSHGCIAVFKVKFRVTDPRIS